MESLWQVKGYPVPEALLQKAPTLMDYPLRVRRFQQGEALVRYQQELTQLSFLVEGRGKVFRGMENGRSVLQAVMESIAVIGDQEFLMGQPRATMDVVAMSKGVLLEIPLTENRGLLMRDAPMLRFLGGEVGRKLDNSCNQNMQNLIYPLQTRLAAYMLLTAQDGFFAENLTRVSELLATSYRHLLRTLKELTERGTILRRPQGYLITDPALLSQLGKGVLLEKQDMQGYTDFQR